MVKYRKHSGSDKKTDRASNGAEKLTELASSDPSHLNSLPSTPFIAARVSKLRCGG